LRHPGGAGAGRSGIGPPESESGNCVNTPVGFCTESARTNSPGLFYSDPRIAADKNGAASHKPSAKAPPIANGQRSGLGRINAYAAESPGMNPNQMKPTITT